MKRILILAVLLAGCGASPSGNPIPSFKQKANYTLDIDTDPETGCEYITRHNDGITPRIAADGKTHMGCKGALP